MAEERGGEDGGKWGNSQCYPLSRDITCGKRDSNFLGSGLCDRLGDDPQAGILAVGFSRRGDREASAATRGPEVRLREMRANLGKIW